MQCGKRMEMGVIYNFANESNYLETEGLRDRISRCEDIETLKSEILPLLETQRNQWMSAIKGIISSSGMTKSRFAELNGVSRVTVDKWCKGSLPRERETYIRIGMSVGMNKDQINQLLQRFGRYPALYPKNLDDCVCLFVLENYSGPEIFEKYKYILGKIRNSIFQPEIEMNGDMATQVFAQKLSDVKNDTELEKFISENISVFSKAFHSLYAQIIADVTYYCTRYNERVADFASSLGWSSTLIQTVSTIRHQKWRPTRNMIISLGINLSMEQEMIDELLEMAHMEKLCAKNTFEAVIIFILTEASLRGYLDRQSDDFAQETLRDFSREILREFDFPEIDTYIGEVSENDNDTL